MPTEDTYCAFFFCCSLQNNLKAPTPAPGISPPCKQRSHLSWFQCTLWPHTSGHFPISHIKAHSLQYLFAKSCPFSKCVKPCLSQLALHVCMCSSVYSSICHMMSNDILTLICLLWCWKSYYFPALADSRETGSFMHSLCPLLSSMLYGEPLSYINILMDRMSLIMFTGLLYTKSISFLLTKSPHKPIIHNCSILKKKKNQEYSSWSFHCHDICLLLWCHTMQKESPETNKEEYDKLYKGGCGLHSSLNLYPSRIGNSDPAIFKRRSPDIHYPRCLQCYTKCVH